MKVVFHDIWGWRYSDIADLFYQEVIFQQSDVNAVGMHQDSMT